MYTSTQLVTSYWNNAQREPGTAVVPDSNEPSPVASACVEPVLPLLQKVGAMLGIGAAPPKREVNLPVLQVSEF